MAEIAAGGKSGKVVIKNIGLLLSGDIDKPILDADTIVAADFSPGTSDCGTARSSIGQIGSPVSRLKT